MEHRQSTTDISERSGIRLPIEQGGYESLVQDTAEGHKSLSLLVKGVHCAGCIQKIESSLLSNTGAHYARLNFSTGRLQIQWDGKASQANAYAEKVEELGYSVYPYSADIEKSESEKEWRFLLFCLGIAGFAMGNIMLLSIGVWITTSETMGEGTREFLHWFSALIGIPAVLICGRPFFRSAIKALKNKHTNMDVPISLALILATGMSIAQLLQGAEHVYFDSAVMLMFFLLIGRVLDFKARRSARSAATDLMSTLHGFANVVDGNKMTLTPIQDLREDMIVRVAVGEKIPVDGSVIFGEGAIDTSFVTGETLPRAVKSGDQVYAGTINLDAPLKIKVEKAAGESLLADIVRLMEKAEQGQAAYVRIADRAARLYTPVVHSLAAVAFMLWFGFLGADWQTSLMIAVTVLIITCPCALGLAVPVVQVLASSLLMKKHIMVKSGDALERLSGIDVILFDKTGTLTLGKPRLTLPVNEHDLQMAASLAVHSKHPLSQAIAKAYDGDLFTVENLREIAGQGLEAQVSGQTVRLGKRDWCGNLKAPANDGLEIWLAFDDKVVQFTFTDQLRKDSTDVISAFAKHHIGSIMLSGDRKDVVDRVAKECGIDDGYGDLTPPEKFEYLEALKKEGHKVLMVGDGLNDAPALSGADVSMAPGTAIDMAQNAADIVFMGDDLKPVLSAYMIAKRTQILVKQNFALAILYNVIAVPIAFMGLVTPMVAALAMSGSSLLVIANAFRLRWSS